MFFSLTETEDEELSFVMQERDLLSFSPSVKFEMSPFFWRAIQVAEGGLGFCTWLFERKYFNFLLIFCFFSPSTRSFNGLCAYAIRTSCQSRNQYFLSLYTTIWLRTGTIKNVVMILKPVVSFTMLHFLGSRSKGNSSCRLFEKELWDCDWRLVSFWIENGFRANLHLIDSHTNHVQSWISQL
jgi:hypothetical protein